MGENDTSLLSRVLFDLPYMVFNIRLSMFGQQKEYL